MTLIHALKFNSSDHQILIDGFQIYVLEMAFRIKLITSKNNCLSRFNNCLLVLFNFNYLL